MFRRIRRRVFNLERVLSALISLLHERDIVKRDEIQLEILAQASRKEDDTIDIGGIKYKP